MFGQDSPRLLLASVPGISSARLSPPAGSGHSQPVLKSNTWRVPVSNCAAFLPLLRISRPAPTIPHATLHRHKHSDVTIAEHNLGQQNRRQLNKVAALLGREEVLQDDIAQSSSRDARIVDRSLAAVYNRTRMVLIRSI